MKIKYVILDRDGTLIKYIPYLFEKEKVELITGTLEAINQLIKKNIKIYLHTNQSGVGRGYFGISDVVDCNNKMIELIGLGQNIFQEICVAPDFPPSKVSYRKPSSLFANELIKKYDLDKKAIVYVGDSISDLKTAKNVGCNAYGVMSGGYDLETLIKSETDLKYDIFSNLLEVVNHLIKNKKI
ncbi:HAD-IIIA family hydrolase [Flavobacteriaceae bacterium]|nr:HAD-IIIA family hydrolase [Flavobacteriaceae bacterium]